MLLRWMGTSQVRFLFLGCERLDAESTLTGAWNTPSQLTGDGQVCATVSPPKSCTSILRLLTELPEDTGDPRSQHQHHRAAPEAKHAVAWPRHRTTHSAPPLLCRRPRAPPPTLPERPPPSGPHAGRDGVLLCAQSIRIDGRNFEDGVAHPLR